MMKKFISSLLLALFLLAANSASFAEPRFPLLLPPTSVPTNVDNNSIPAVLPRSQVLLDERLLAAFFDQTCSMSIDEIADKAKEELFTPFSLQPFEKVSGAIWLRFVLAPTEESSLPPNQLFLDLGTSVPEKATLYVRSQTLKEPTPSPKEEITSKAKGTGTLDVQSSDLASPNLPLEWTEILPVKRGLFVLPKAGKTALTCYLHLDGVPGVWFTPVVRTVENTLRDWGSFYRLGAVIVMSVLFVLCLFRCLVEQGTWRLWGLLYILCAGAQMWIGIPSVQETLAWRTLLALLLPALALTLYPHLGRKLLRCPKEAPLLNAQFILLSLVALAVIALPFIPSMKWIYRFIDLWPLGLLLFVPTALFACFRRRPGAFRFFIGSLIPPATILALGYAGAQTPFSANFISAIPAWATAFSAIFIIGLPLSNSPQKTLSLNLDNPHEEESGELSLGTPEKKQGSSLTLLEEGKKTSQSEKIENLALQAALANSVASLYEQSKILCSAQLPEPAKTASLQIARSAEEISLALEGKGQNNSHAPLAVSIFNIRNLLSSTRESIQQKLAQKKAFISWTAQPNLGEYYEGPAMEFAHVVTMLCESMTIPESQIRFTFKPEASKGTAVRFLVTIAGGSTMPSPLAITAAKRLAQECRGGFKLESRPTESTVLFNVGFIQKVDTKASSSLENLQQTEKKLNLLFLIEDPRISVSLLALSKELPCTIRLAAKPEELVALHQKYNAQMFIFQGQSIGTSSERLIATLKQISAGKGLPSPLFLAYTIDKSNWNGLAKIGFTHALTLPVAKASFVETFSEAFHESFSAQQRTEGVRTPKPPLQMTQTPNTQQLQMTVMPEPTVHAMRTPEPPLQMTQAPDAQELQMTGIPQPTVHTMRAPEPPLQMTQTPDAQQLQMTIMSEPTVHAMRAPEPPLQMTQTPDAQQLQMTVMPEPTVHAMRAPEPPLQMTQTPESSLQIQDLINMPQVYHNAKENFFTPAESFKRHLPKAIQALKDKDWTLLAISTGTIALVAAKTNMETISRIALLATRAARAGDEKTTQDMLSELSIAIERKMQEMNLPPL